MATEPEGLETNRRNPWPLVVIAVILFTITIVVARFWEIVLVLFVLLLFNLSWRLRSRANAVHNGAYVLSYGGGMAWFAIISAFVLIMLILMSAVFGSSEPGELTITSAVVIMSVFLITWPLFIEGTFSWYIVNNEGIDRHSAWSRHLFMRWSEIDSITFTAVNQWFVIKGNMGTIRLHAYLIGLPEFARAVRKHVPPERWDKAKGMIETLAEDS